MRNRNFILGILILVLMSCGSDKVICDGRVIVHAKGRVKFSKNEQPLLCGDKDLREWKNVPLAQTEMSMKEFLKGRGYYQSRFVLKNEKLHVYTGKPYQVQNVIFIGAPEDFDRVRFIGWKKKPFTSSTLNDIEGWTLRRLKSLGYACAQVKSQAIIQTQSVEVFIQPGRKYIFPEITYDDDPKKTMKPSILERYYAFELGDMYNEDLLSLSSRRTEEDGVVSHSNFISHCENEDLTIKQTVNLGTSRLLTVGAGISTEEFPIAKVSWKDSRKGENASIIFANLYGSQLRQYLEVGYEWHAFDRSNRWFLMPQLNGERVDESDQEYYNFMLYQSIGAKFDYTSLQFEFNTGPAGAFEDAQEGPTTGQKAFGLWRGSFIFTGHDYEVFMAEPRRGFRVQLDTSTVGLTTVDQIGANWINLTGTRLWNLFNFGPPKYVFGVRFGLESVLAVKDDDVRNNIPSSYFTWLGGDTSLRGFDRQELPFDQIGTLASVFSGFEVRFVSLLMKNLDPFVFTDLGLLGNENFKFDWPLYWSPGLGLRYQSFIGVIRGTVAHGFITGAGDPDHEHFQYFLSLGREF